jgi:hypothetical protein
MRGTYRRIEHLLRNIVLDRVAGCHPCHPVDGSFCKPLITRCLLSLRRARLVVLSESIKTTMCRLRSKSEPFRGRRKSAKQCSAVEHHGGVSPFSELACSELFNPVLEIDAIRGSFNPQDGISLRGPRDDMRTGTCRRRSAPV